MVVLKDLADTHFPHAKVIVLVQDNLNIHSKASVYEAFPSAGEQGICAGDASMCRALERNVTLDFGKTLHRRVRRRLRNRWRSGGVLALRAISRRI